MFVPLTKSLLLVTSIICGYRPSPWWNRYLDCVRDNKGGFTFWMVEILLSGEACTPPSSKSKYPAQKTPNVRMLHVHGYHQVRCACWLDTRCSFPDKCRKRGGRSHRYCPVDRRAILVQLTSNKRRRRPKEG